MDHIADWTIEELLDETRASLAGIATPGLSLVALRPSLPERGGDRTDLVCELLVPDNGATARWRLTLPGALDDLQDAFVESAGLIVAANIDEWWHDPHPAQVAVRVS